MASTCARCRPISSPARCPTWRRCIAHERLLLDLLEGDPTLFVRRAEVEAQWHWIDGIRDGWAVAGMAPKVYPSNTWGPVAAIALAERDGVSWRE